jgi:hypothetical protein
VSLSGVESARRVVAVAAAELRPEAVPLPEAPAMWAEWDQIERLAVSAKTLLAERVDESKAWKRAGFRSAAEHLAAIGDTTVGAAREALAVSRQLAGLLHTASAMRAGALSMAQAAAIVPAAAADPSAELRLLDTAGRTSLGGLRDECLRTKANADADREVTYRRIHQERRLRTWTDAEGAWNLVARGTPEAGARVLAALDSFVASRFERARKAGIYESREAHAFDALVDLAEQKPTAGGGATGKRRPPQHLALLRVDLEALTRGRTAGDEVCELTGLGPIPVSRARALLGDSTLRLVITKGVDVVNVTHLGRGPTAAQRIALLWSSPTCTVEGCTRTRVEIDHRDDWAKVRRTELDNLDPLCSHHHARKTRDSWALVAGTGKRPMVPPNDPRHPKQARRRGTRSPPSESAA